MTQKEKHRLRLQQKIGRGAFGDVFKGTMDGEVVAVKTISAAHAQDPLAEQMFLREAQILERCSHRNIIGFKKLCKFNPQGSKSSKVAPDSSDGKWALVLEFAKGGTFMKKISAQMVAPGSKVYSDVQALQWSRELASALESLHLRSPAVFHRDVKTSNVMLGVSACGQLEAKLSDFGLHVVADGTRDRRIRISSALAKSVPGTGLQQQEQQQLLVQQLLVVRQQQDATSRSEFCGDSAWQQQRRSVDGLREKPFHSAPVGVAGSMGPRSAAGGMSQADQMYSEMHDSGGSLSFVGLAGRTSTDTNACVRPGSSSWLSAAAATAAAAADKAEEQQQPEVAGVADDARPRRPPVARKRSFRRASHHPAGDLSVPRVGALLPQQQQQQQPGGAGGSSDPGGQPTSLGRAVQSFTGGGGSAYWDAAVIADGGAASDLASDGESLGGSIAATDATWASQANSCCSSTADDDYESLVSELETVFDMTGVTGSCLTMAPEVFQGESYNEKADVFSFGVVLYELMARCLILFTELPTVNAGPSAATDYARKVAGGYRPGRPKKLSDGVWQLIQACWHQDPIHRPHMSEIVDVLTTLLEAEKAARGGGRASVGRRPSSGLAARSASSGLPVAVPESHSMICEELDTAVTAVNAGEQGGPAKHSSDNAAPRLAEAAAGRASCQPDAKAAQGCACVIC